MRKTVVMNVVGLTPRLVERMPTVKRFAHRGRLATVGHVLPAVTCAVQATYLTGTLPREHGIVGNGWYFRDECVVRFWHQSDKLVQRPRIWQTARQRDPSFTCANLFWWHAMYSAADVTVTPRPMYPADGRKIPDLWTHPRVLRSWLQDNLGPFPLFKFWGPATSIESTQWIAEAAIEVDLEHHPTLSLIYLPHLDYGLQRFGPDDPRIGKELEELDGVIALLLDHFGKDPQTRIVLLSEYGIEPVSRAVHVNRVLREQGLLVVRKELDRELLDAGASAAFAVADHQIAHVYVNDARQRERVRDLLGKIPGVAEVLGGPEQAVVGTDHPRSGEYVILAEPGAWFTYYYWLDDAKAPDFARTVDIHRKPGYDPAELFIDPGIALPKLRIAWKLLIRRLGFRSLLDVIPMDATLVRGSHGRAPADPAAGPVLISSEPNLLPSNHIGAVEVYQTVLGHLFD